MTTHSSLSARAAFVSLVSMLAVAALSVPAHAQTPAPPAPAPAPAAGPKPIALGNGVVFSTAIRSRTYAWDWFGDDPGGDYTYQGTQVRFGITQTKKKYDLQLEFEVPFMIALPDDAVKPPPQGQLGLGANYYAANSNSQNPIGFFLKQGTIRFKGIGGSAASSLKIGRFEFNDGLEMTPRHATLATLNRDRISQRILGNFGFTDVLRSLDGVHYVYSSPKTNVTALAVRPTEGVFQVNGWPELDINVFYASLTKQAGTERNPNQWRVFGMGYHDYRDNVVKTDNRPALVRNGDHESIAIATFGGNLLQIASTRTGPVDILLWGLAQTGSWGTQSHRAGALAAEIGWQPAVLPKLKPWFRFGYGSSSGDGNPNDDAHTTFMQMLPTARIYARTPFYGLMNLTDIFGSVIVRPSPRLTVRGDLRSLHLTEGADLWYAGGGAFQPTNFGFSGRPSNGHTDLAQLYDVQGDYTFNPHLALALYFGYGHNGAVTRAIFPQDTAIHLFFAEWNVRF